MKSYTIKAIILLCGLVDLNNVFYSSKTYFGREVSKTQKCI